jgi:hypothetical protein
MDSSQAVINAAQLALGQWRSRVGDAGTAAMRVLPGLLAEVDQHASHVRATVTDRRGRLRSALLAAYADGVADAAAEKGWSPVEVLPEQWRTASWPSVRLLAVCVLAEQAA